MSWCPKCKNEYYAGIKVCADCGSELVDSLEEWEKAEREVKEAERKAQLAALEEMLSEENTEGRAVEVWEDAEDAERNQSEEALDFADNFVSRAEKEAEEASRGVYQNYEEKAADNKSSAYTLLTVGIVGLVVIILCFCDVIRLPISESSRFMTFGVMGAMFLFFAVMGVVSMKNAGKYAQKAESEKELTKELEKWFVECMSAEKIEEGLFTQEEADFSEEQKYFKRLERMKKLLAERFLNLNEGYVDRFLDQHYQDVFGENKDV